MDCVKVKVNKTYVTYMLRNDEPLAELSDSQIHKYPIPHLGEMPFSPKYFW